jgi:WD repeat-containing protein 23
LCGKGRTHALADEVHYLFSFQGDGRYLITSSKDQSIKLWDMRKFSDAEGKWVGIEKRIFDT